VALCTLFRAECHTHNKSLVSGRVWLRASSPTEVKAGPGGAGGGARTGQCVLARAEPDGAGARLGEAVISG